MTLRTELLEHERRPLGPSLLALDLGSGSCRAALFDTGGRQVAMGQREYVHPSEPGVPGSQVFETTRNWLLIVELIRDALATAGCRAEEVVAVGVSSMREGFVLSDAAGRELWACPNADARAVEEAVALIGSGAAPRMFEIAGDWVTLTVPARLHWLAKHRPEILEATAHLDMLGDWVVARLTGEHATDPSLGSSSGLFELATRGWSGELVGSCGIDVSLLPSVLSTGTVVGGMTRQAAEACGLAAGTPVAVGAADTQLALAGLGLDRPGQCAVVGGTHWQQAVVLGEPTVDPRRRVRTLCHTAPGRWMAEGIGVYSGYALRWFRDGFCELELQEAASEGIDPYRLLEVKATTVPAGCGGLLGIFSNLMQADRWRHAAPGFVGFDLGRSDARIACVRAIEEAAAYVSRGHLGFLEELLGVPVEDVVLTGGAARATLWPQILADVLGRPVRIPLVSESSLLGAALYAGQGAGLWSDACERAASLGATERIVEPRRADTECRDLYAKWADTYRRELGLIDAGLAEPLWRAAGS